MTTADAKVELVEQLWADLRSRCPSISALTEDSREVALTKAHLRAAITALEAPPNSRTEATKRVSDLMLELRKTIHPLTQQGEDNIWRRAEKACALITEAEETLAMQAARP